MTIFVTKIIKMKISYINDSTDVKHCVVIGSKENYKELKGKFDSKLFEAFLELNEDLKTIDDLKKVQYFISEKDDAEKMRRLGAQLRTELGSKVENLSIIGDEKSVFYVVEGLLLANYQFLKYFSDKDKKQNALSEIFVSNSLSIEECESLLNIQKTVTWARDMVNEPVSFLNAEQLAAEISSFAVNTDIEVSVLEKTQIESLKMGGLLSVNQGSIDPPTFTIMEYKPKNAVNKKPIVLVGKGVVYDTGGLSLKPTANSMDVMKSDMGGAACVAGATFLVALQKLPIHVITLIPATDNRPGLNAVAPGDVVKMFNGTTVEVLNTDAEGRMILADALSYSAKFDPMLVIDAATLTGAAYRAIGQHGTVVMGNADASHFETLRIAGDKAYERTVEFPFWDEYYDDMKSSIADLKNIGGPTAGMITAGKFLEHFVDAPYIHMDIAGPAWLDKNDHYRTKGGSGVGVRLLYNFFNAMV